ncbi:MAG: tetratricopeptide repeat protein [Candidatus Aminicenantes bacterium]|nr:tetratricopeptide repeat protein [Candidatus Aminicenantes bacterium]
MKRWILLLVSVSIALSFCSARKNYFKSEVDFANKLAAQGMWKEAYFRWQKALSRGKESALIHNNMAVALEKMEKFKEAEDAYKKALKLSPGNALIKKNYEKLKRILEGKPGEEEKKRKKKKKKENSGMPKKGSKGNKGK